MFSKQNNNSKTAKKHTDFLPFPSTLKAKIFECEREGLIEEVKIGLFCCTTANKIGKQSLTHHKVLTLQE